MIDIGTNNAELLSAKLIKSENKLIVRLKIKPGFTQADVLSVRIAVGALASGCTVEVELEDGAKPASLPEASAPAPVNAPPKAAPVAAKPTSMPEASAPAPVSAPPKAAPIAAKPAPRDACAPKKTEAAASAPKDNIDSYAGYVSIPPKNMLYGVPRRVKTIHMRDVDELSGTVCVRGFVTGGNGLDIKEVKGGEMSIVTMNISDKTNTLTVKTFFDKQRDGGRLKKLEKAVSSGDWLYVHGRYSFDEYKKSYVLIADFIARTDAVLRKDDCEQKRVELHLHTKMSAMDATVDIQDAVKTAARWGHKAVAITDHGVVQAFPAAVSAAQKLKKAGKEIKVVLGVEGYLLPDCELVEVQTLTQCVAVDFLCEERGQRTEIFQIAAARFDQSGEIVQSFLTLANPGAPVSEALMRAANITDIDSAPYIDVAVASLNEFIGDDTIVVHGVERARTLIDRLNAVRGDGAAIKCCIDTMRLTHYLKRDYKELATPTPSIALSANAYKIQTGRLTCAEDTARAIVLIFAKIKEQLISLGAKLPLLETAIHERVKGKRENFHIILLAKNHEGLLNLYRLVSYSHMEYLKKVPRIPKSLLAVHRNGVILGSACEAGELFRAITYSSAGDEKRIERIAAEYDYLEIQPIGNNMFMVRDGIVSCEDDLRALNKRIVALADKLNKPVVATGDVHFLEPEDSVYRAILMSARDFKDAEQQAPLYFKTTKEMLDEFSYLGEDKAYEVVVKNPNMIADMCDSLKPFLSEKSTYAPEFPGASDELRSMAMTKAHEIYGDPLPEVVRARLKKELDSIIGNGYASLYLMAQRLVRKSNADGYLVGSRGSVGSSFVATMAGITEVNPLQPHYVCSKCKYSDFEVDLTKYSCGIDMPDKDCPNCGNKLDKLGYEIPFEVFLGFKGDKTPDIDLNFSGENQSEAHKYTEVMFGAGHAFRAGTISGLKDKTIYGYIKKYCEAQQIHISRAEEERLIEGCLGVKRTTGQHPGGIVVVPEDRDIMEFTPVQFPADDEGKNTVTTHFDFHAMDDRLVKLDILGHDDPTMLKRLKDLTGLDPSLIPLDDKPTMKLYSSIKPLNISLAELNNCDVGSVAIPEFGTSFVRQMLMDTRPTTMEELVRISGLSHGTNVWLGNAQELIKSGVAVLSEVICTRDDIMNKLILYGAEPSISFKTMESVRKGRGLNPDMESAIHHAHMPPWFIESCKKIAYLFPRAHAAAYVMMGFRVAYYKMHYPLAFYAAYFTIRAVGAFDYSLASGGAKKVLENIKELYAKGNDIETKESDNLVTLEVVYEMNLRGIELLPVDLYKSRAQDFVIEGNALRPPFTAISGIGLNAAIALEEGAHGGEYISIEDLQNRGKANSAAIKALGDAGALDGLPETNQITLFSY